jgi:hypothetical protein
MVLFVRRYASMLVWRPSRPIPESSLPPKGCLRAYGRVTVDTDGTGVEPFGDGRPEPVVAAHHENEVVTNSVVRKGGAVASRTDSELCSTVAPFRTLVSES